MSVGNALIYIILLTEPPPLHKSIRFLSSHIKLYYEATHHKNWMFYTTKTNRRARYNASRKTAYHNEFNSLLGGLMKGTNHTTTVAMLAREDKTFDALVEGLLETTDGSSSGMASSIHHEKVDQDAFNSLLGLLLM
jgi:hypothetical protein